MKESEQIKEIHISESSIKKIINKIKNLKFSDLKKTEHYEKSVLMKNTDEDLLEKRFIEFDRIKSCAYRVRENGYNNYDLHYEEDDGTFILIAINLEIDPPELINGFKYHTIYKNFINSLIKNYAKRLV
jgi:hypothetical protein